MWRSILALTLLLTTPALAQEEAPDGTPGEGDSTDAAPSASFPILLRSVSVPLPVGTLEAGGDAVEVLVRIVVAVDGSVPNAQLVKSTGIEARDEAALLAARSLSRPQ